MTSRLALLGGVAVAAALAVPQFVSGPNLELVAVAVLLAGPACGTALACATGRPLLAASALAGLGAYVSGIVSLRGVPVPLAILCGTAAGAVAGGFIASVGAWLEAPGFLVATIVFTLALGEGVQALPSLTGGQSGLGPLAPISLGLGGSRTGSRTLVFTTRGEFHLLLLVAVLIAGAATFLIRRRPGPAWRAVGSDRERAAASGLNPLVCEIAVLVTAGAMAGICGAFAAHLEQVATPSQFALDAAALPFLAALCARNEPVTTALVAVGAGVLGTVILPTAGWTGPPTAQSLALAVLAVAALVALVPGGSAAAEVAPVSIDPASEWPVGELGLRGAVLTVPPIRCHSRHGVLLVDSPTFVVEPGTIHVVVGPNGAGKTSLLREIERRCSQGSAVVAMGDGTAGRLALLPQEGGGFGNCSVGETLLLAARRGRRHDDAAAMAATWVRRLGLHANADQRCAELSTAQRRLVDLSRVLLGAPNVLLCDEPLAGLDDASRAAAVGCLAAAAAAGLTIVVAEHDREAVTRLADSITELERVPEPKAAPPDRVS
ncbi:MAG TPA: ATP-binding cassette domain-containing protein [Acidimicrobiales bacterium]|nr:ATP-binding cassette domain-containing protein [Acidimicrobiales bacterium]